MTEDQRMPAIINSQKHEELLEHAAQRMVVLRQLNRLMLREYRAKVATSDEAHLGAPHIHTLFILDEAEQLSAGELADRCHVADPTMSKTLNQLEAHGLIIRRTDPANRRTVHVTLTDAGHSTLKQIQAEWLKVMAQILHPLTDAELQDLIVAFSHLERLVGYTERTETAPASAQGE